MSENDVRPEPEPEPAGFCGSSGFVGAEERLPREERFERPTGWGAVETDGREATLALREVRLSGEGEAEPREMEERFESESGAEEGCEKVCGAGEGDSVLSDEREVRGEESNDGAGRGGTAEVARRQQEDERERGNQAQRGSKKQQHSRDQKVTYLRR